MGCVFPENTRLSLRNRHLPDFLRWFMLRVHKGQNMVFSIIGFIFHSFHLVETELYGVDFIRKKEISDW